MSSTPTHTRFNSAEQIKSYVHSIHNFIRNSGAGYGMSALKLFNVFYSLKILDGKMDTYGYTKKCEWQYIKNLTTANIEINIINIMNELREAALNTNTKNTSYKYLIEIYDTMKKYNFNGNIDEDKNAIYNTICKRIDDIPNTTNELTEKRKKTAFFIYHQIPTNLISKFYIELIKKIDALPVSNDRHTYEENNFDIKGKVYEYFIGRDKSAISDLGAFFTDRSITAFIIVKLDPQVIDGKVGTMIDMFAGSGGFTISYTDFINKKFNPDWTAHDNYKNIYHCDMAEDVIKLAGIEYQSITGHFPDNVKQFVRMNSFQKPDFFTPEKKYKYVISNPPYGGDKNNKTPEIIRFEAEIKLNETEIQNINTTDLHFTDKIFTKLLNAIKTNIKIDNTLVDNERKRGNDTHSIKTITDETTRIITDIEIFKLKAQQIINSCITVKTHFEKHIDNYYNIVRRVWQNMCIETIINTMNKDSLEEKVNYNTCSDYIKTIGREIVYYNETYNNEQLIKHIDTILLTYETYENTDENTDENTAPTDNLLIDIQQKEYYIKYKTDTQKILTKFKALYEHNKSIIPEKIINFNDKEACSLILLMNVIEDNGGICIGVLKEGVLFDSKYSDLRIYLINHFDVTDIWSVDANAFENTTTKTSIVKFIKRGTTTNPIKTEFIRFWDLQFEKQLEDKRSYDLIKGVLTLHNKNDIIRPDPKLICTVSYSQLTEFKLSYNSKKEPKYSMPCSLNGKDYIKQDNGLVAGDGYELVKLGDICEFMPKSKRKASYGNTTGKFNFYTSSDKVQKCDVADYKEECLIIGTGGIKIDNLFSCSTDNIILKTPYNLYIYNLIKSNMKLLTDGFSGSVLKHLSKDYLLNLKLPIPKSPEKIKYWVDKISKPYNEKNEKQTKIKELEAFIQKRIREIGENEDCDEVELGNVCKILTGVKHCTNIAKKTGLYKFYNSSQDSNLFVDFCEITEESIIIGQGGRINIHYDKNFTPSKHVSVLQSITKNNIELQYYYIFIKNMLHKFEVNGSTINWLNKENIKKFKIRIPKNKQLIKDLDPIFQEIETLQNDVKTAETLYKLLIDELSEEAMPKDKQLIKPDLLQQQPQDYLQHQTIDNIDDE